jgi:hypothetical protein
MKQASRWNEADHLTTAARDYERFLPYSRRENDQALLASHAALQIPFLRHRHLVARLEHSATKQLQH